MASRSCLFFRDAALLNGAEVIVLVVSRPSLAAFERYFETVECRSVSVDSAERRTRSDGRNRFEGADVEFQNRVAARVAAGDAGSSQVRSIKDIAKNRALLSSESGFKGATDAE